MKMQTAVTQRGVSLAPAILVTLEMGSTVQVRYFVNFSRMKRNIPCVECMSCHCTAHTLNTRCIWMMYLC